MTSRFVILMSLIALVVSSNADAADYAMKAGSTDRSVYVTLYAGGDPAGVNPPTPVTGVAYNDGNLKAYYLRPGGTLQQITLQSQTVNGSHADGGWIQLSSTNAPGRYRLDLPDAVVAASVPNARVMVSYYNGTFSVVDDIDIDLVGYDPTAAAIAANAIQINSNATAAANLQDALDENGSSGVAMSLESIFVQNPTGNAVTLLATGASGTGLYAEGNSGAHGIHARGGVTGVGLRLQGGSTSGDALFASATDGDGFDVRGGNSGHGARFVRGGISGDDMNFANDDIEVNADVAKWLGTTAATPTVAGVPEIDLTHVAGQTANPVSGNVDANVAAVSGSATAADRAESFFTTGYGPIIVRSAVTSSASQSSFVFQTGAIDLNDALNGAICIVTDDDNANRKSLRVVTDYSYSTGSGTVTLDSATGFSMDAGDSVEIFTP